MSHAETSPQAAKRTKLRRIVALSIILALAWGGAAFALDRAGLDRPAEAARYDAIIVLGCRVQPNGRPSLSLARRTRLAVGLFESGHAPLIVFTGGVGDFGPSEAEAAADLARGLGVPRSAMRLEDRSTSTQENAKFAAAKLDAKRLLLVSDSYHLVRARMVFARYFDAQIDLAGSTATPAVRARGALREVLAISAYAVLGRL